MQDLTPSLGCSRRQFIARLAGVPGLLALPHAGGLSHLAAMSLPASLGFPDAALHWRGDSSITAAQRAGEPVLRRDRRVQPPKPDPFDWDAAGTLLRKRFADLRRHFVFEYYPWYGANPWRHWNDAGRLPPIDIASNYVPLLGPYDSMDAKVVERHAAWIAKSGVGAVNISWWGPGSDTDLAVPLVMDVMRAHDIHVTFHLEPYTSRRADVYARDVLYLLEEYGRKRRWDCFLLPQDAAGKTGPIFKSFRTILPTTVTDCHGLTYPVPDYTADSAWRKATDTVRDTLRSDFDRVTLLADSLDFGRTPAAGFDGIAIYDNYLEPTTLPGLAAGASARGLVFSFNANPGFDAVALREVAPDSCYRPPRFAPESGEVGWQSAAGRRAAARASSQRIRESLETTVRLQIDPSLGDVGKGFFLTYINSFNEWHEGHQFEPMKDFSRLSAAERALGYHNPIDGDYRMQILTARLEQLLG